MVGRNIKYPAILLISALWSFSLTAQPAGYYDSASGLTGTALKQALHDIIDNHTERTYTNLWTDFQSTDKKSNGSVWDMYSDIPGGTPAYSFIFVTNQCGNYNSEGDCYNREHSFPKSWFGGEITPMYTDLFHLYPTDGWVNNQRGNLPFGTTSSATYTSSNGSKVGPCSYPGYSGAVFEPRNDYKGDFARTYFYMAVRYYGEDSSWPGSDMVDGAQPVAWALKMLMEWDIADPVSIKETDRNNAVYTIQGNRNPFIDNTTFVNKIWGTQSGTNDLAIVESLRVWPNPADDILNIELPECFPGNYNLKIADATGKIVLEKWVNGNPVTLDVSQIKNGFYIFIITSETTVVTSRFIIGH
jgi:endonuclease I